MEDYHNGTTEGPSLVKLALLEQVHETRKFSCSIETQTEEEDYYEENFGFTTISEESPEQVLEASRESPETVVIETSSHAVQTSPVEEVVTRNSLPVLSEKSVDDSELNSSKKTENSLSELEVSSPDSVDESESETAENLTEDSRINTTPEFNSVTRTKPVLGEVTEIEFFCETDEDRDNGDLSAMSREEFEMIEQVCAELDKNSTITMSDLNVTDSGSVETKAKVVNGEKMADGRNRHDMTVNNNNTDTDGITNGDSDTKVELKNGGCEMDSVKIIKGQNKNEEKHGENCEINGNYAESNSDSVSTISEVSSEDSLSPTKPKPKSGLPVPCRLPVKSEHGQNRVPVKSEHGHKPAARMEEVASDHHDVKRGNNKTAQNGHHGPAKRQHTFKTAATEIVHYCASTKQPKQAERQRSSSVEREPLRKRSSSVVDLRTTHTSKDSPVQVRDNAASRKRMSALRTEPEPEPDYMTPLQRKDAVIKELRGQLADAQRASDDRASSIEVEMDGQRFAYEERLLEKDDLITKLDQTLRDLDESHQNIVTERAELHRQLEELTKEHEALKEEVECREKVHQERYLEMYNKGRDSARFERRDELEALAKSGTEEVSVAELLEKVKLTEQELEWWQSARRDELYRETALPETSADATLRFLRDSMFHYLMRGPDAEQHMQAIISIFKFTDTQLKNIKKAEKKKRKSTS